MRSDNIKLKDIVWNTLGTITYSAVSLLLSVVIINICGNIEGGIFSFGFSTFAHLIFIISFFGIRPMHIVDIKYRYSFKDYVHFGIKTFLISIFAGICYISFRYINGNYNSIKSILLLILVLHGALDGFADYFECEYQRVNKLFMSGQSTFFRILSFTATLIIVVYITNNLLIAEIAAFSVECLAFYLFNIARSKNVFKTAKLVDNSNKNQTLFFEALPLFLITFLDMYIFSSAKMSIDANLSDVYSGFFNLLFMPTNVIYLVMTLFMKPILTPLSNAYYNNKDEYRKILFGTFIIALLISIVSFIAAILMGNIYLDLINYVTGNAYSFTRNEIVYNGLSIDYLVFLIVMFGGMFYTICTPMYFAIIIESKQRYLVISYIVVAIISIFISKTYVVNYGIIGAAVSFVISMFLLFVGVIVVKVLTNR
ncbi:MAG: hypothetical protein J6M39_07635 [Lachnospiraceae bacterium]|nr:hypothetical protein [Lachnospiraceae bacterium]